MTRQWSTKTPAIPRILGSVVLSMFICSTAFGQLAPPPDPRDDFTGQFDGGLGFGGIDEDYFLRLNLGAVFQFEPIRFGVQVPLNLRVIDNSPETDGVLRSEDWDEVNDYFKIVRFVEYGSPGEPVYARLGELAGVSVGHGTVMDRYYNVVTVDNYKMGVYSRVDIGYGGAELVLDHIAPPSLLGARAFVRPLTFFDVDELFKRLSTGFFFLGDFNAPTTLEANASGTLRVENTRLLADRVGTAAFYGWDVEWQVVTLDWFTLTPFFDLVGFNDEGFGTHLGVFANFVLPEEIHIDTRFEWRFASSRYQPNYFNSLYEVERWSFLGSPKLAAVRQDATREDRHGFYGSLDVNVGGYITAGVTFEDYAGPHNSNFTARVSLPYISVVKLAAYYTKRNFSHISDLGNLDEALLVALVRAKLLGPLYASAEYARQWRLQDDGRYLTVDNWNVGAGVEFTF